MQREGATVLLVADFVPQSNKICNALHFLYDVFALLDADFCSLIL